MSLGEFKERINQFFEIKEVSPKEQVFDTAKEMIEELHNIRNAYQVSLIVDEAKKEFPWKTLQFMDARYTDECEDFRKEVHKWFMEWFGSKEVKL